MNEETKDPEVKQPEAAQEPTQAPAPAALQPREDTVGDIMKKAGERAIKSALVIVSILVYVAGIIYAEVHGLTMLQKGVSPDMRIWAGVGMVAAGATALAMPAVLKVWAIEAKHRLYTYVFYALDFAFLAFNAFIDFNNQTGATLAGWAQTYTTYILPASPVFITLLWAIFWELDPTVKAKVLQLTLREAMKEKVAQKVMDAAKGANVDAVINAAAAHEVDQALSDLFQTKAQGGYYAIESNALPRRTAAQSFFDGLFSLARRALSSVTGTQSQPLDSSQQDEAEQ